MSRVYPNSVSITVHGIIQLVNETVLVTEQGVTVRKLRVHQNRTLEELDGSFVLLLKWETVSYGAPRLKLSQLYNRYTMISSESVANNRNCDTNSDISNVQVDMIESGGWAAHLHAAQSKLL